MTKDTEKKNEQATSKQDIATHWQLEQLAATALKTLAEKEYIEANTEKLKADTRLANAEAERLERVNKETI